HAGDALADELLVGEGLAELEARHAPLGGLVADLAGPAEHARAERAAPVVQAGEGHLQAAALLAEQVRLGDANAVEADAGLPRAADAALGAVLLEDVHAFHPRVHDDGGDLP